MELLMQIPAMVKILLVFAIVLGALRFKMLLGNAFLLGSMLVGLFFGMAPHAMMRSIIASALMSKTLALAAVVMLILILSTSMELGGQMTRLLNTFRGLVRNPRLNLALFPALIGLLPMPGGAVFSAPMVKELGNRSGLSPDQLSFINYWYRHIWEYWWPLYPGILLTIAFTDLDLWAFILFMFPLSVAAALLGSLSIRGSILRRNGERNMAPVAPEPFFRELTPILMVIGVGLGMGILLAFVFPGLVAAKELGLIMALCLAIGWVWSQSGMKGASIRKVILDRHLLEMFYMVAGILIFKGMLEDSHAVAVISQEFVSLRIPLPLIVIVLPLLVGGITGITYAFVGSAIPIVILLIFSAGEGSFLQAYVMLALVSGFVGVLLSPLHLCMVLSNQYFGADPVRVYRALLLPCLCLLAAGVVYFAVVRWLIA